MQTCYLTEEDPPEDHDFARFSAVCGRCYGALADLERDARAQVAALTAKLTAAESEAERLRGIAESMRRQIEDRIAERDEALTALADTEATADLYSRLAAAMEFVPLPETLTDERQKASAARLHAADPVVFFNQAEIADQTKGR